MKSTYDTATIALHWMTALVVVALFALAETWDFFPRGPVRDGMQQLHVSLGVALAAVLLVRLVWRATGGRKLPRVDTVVQDRLAALVHTALYSLLVLQVVLGFVFRWAQGEDFTVFGLFAIPSAFAPAKALAHSVGQVHNYVAWAVIVLAGGHASMALYHHYARHDGILQRMLPANGR